METQQISMRNLEDRLRRSDENSWSDKAKEWTKRYLPAEIVATGLTYAASEITYRLTNSETYAAIAATHAGNLGYYGTVFAQDMYREWKNAHKNGDSLKVGKSGLKTLTKMAGEFGVSGTVDTLLTRPIITGACTTALTPSCGRFLGVITGKLMSDVVFYSLTIPAYEAIKKLSNKFKGGTK